MFASVKSMIDNVDKKAASLCESSGFKYIDNSKADTYTSPAYYKGVDISMPYNVLSREIICK